MAKKTMKLSIIAILISLSAICYGQDSTQVQLDTITPTIYSQQALKELTTQLQEIKRLEQETSQKIMLIIMSYIDPRTFAGITEDMKIISKR